MAAIRHGLTFNAASDAYPVWSPDGRQIAFQSDRAGNDEIYVMNADGSSQRNLSHHPGYDAFPDWHPDGERIAFASDRQGGKNRDIFVMDTDGNNVQQITDLYAFPILQDRSGRLKERGLLLMQILIRQDKVRGRFHIVNADGSHPLAA